MALAAVRSKDCGSVVVESLFIVAPTGCGIFCVFASFIIVQYLVSFLVCNHLAGDEIADCLTLIVFLMACGF